MSSRHLPAGQNIPLVQGTSHGPAPGGMPPAPVDIPGGPPAGVPAPGLHGGHHQHHQHQHHHQNHHQNHHSSHGMGPGPRRRQPPPPHAPHPTQHYAPHQYHQPMNPAMYANYMPYSPQQYYPMPPQYQNGAMPGPAYMPYQNYPRSPPAMHHQYSPMVGVTVPPSFPRHSQPSPALSTPYQPPPAPVPIPPQTPSSTHSSQMMPPQTPPNLQQREAVPPPPPAQEPSTAPTVATAVQFRPPLPWFSNPEQQWPARKQRMRLRRKPLTAESQAVSLPVEQHEAATEQAVAAADTPNTQAPELEVQARSQKQTLPSDKSAAASPTTPTQKSDSDTAAGITLTKPSTRPAPTAVPVVPAVPKAATKPSSAEKPQGNTQQAPEGNKESSAAVLSPTALAPETEASDVNTVADAPPKAAPTSWANLFSKHSSAVRSGLNGASLDGAANGDGSVDSAGPFGALNTFPKSNANSVAEAIRAYRVNSNDHISFIEPRGLINTGNMCYMNSILQVLMFCIPFYDFLDQVGKRAAHSFKSETPLIDAMIMFMHEFKVIKSATSIEQLRRSLKVEELDKFGEPFTPEFVYEAIRQLPRFASMRRGHQQDAEEFLGFLLQSLDDECTHVMGTSLSIVAAQAPSDVSSGDGPADATGDWMEVGRKQKAAVTRSAGSSVSTPINKIFGGLLRSEFRVPGLKDSITTEPYQPLQLDIGSPDVRNVVDALRGITRPERLHGDFNSPRGKDVPATKQVFVESLPPVLILHLKRFQFDAEGHGTVKIWKKIDYPLDLEIPREVLSRQKRQTYSDATMPRYKLISVVYHHGKNAGGGHYTVDVRRQDGQDWLRLDDTVLRSVHSEDVAEVGAEEESRDGRKENFSAGAPANRFEAMNGDEADDEDGWKQVTTSAGGNKRWSNVVNGTGNTGLKGKQVKDSVKDNKVAYLLFYQRA